MRENLLFTEKAFTCFLNLQQRYGFGDLYTGFIKIHHLMFDFSNVRINGNEFTIGVNKGRHLTTVVFCLSSDAFKKNSSEGEIVYTLYSGKIAPDNHNAVSYPNVVKLITNTVLVSQMKGISTIEIIHEIGKVDKNKPLPDLRGLSLLELVFQQDGTIHVI